MHPRKLLAATLLSLVFGLIAAVSTADEIVLPFYNNASEGSGASTTLMRINPTAHVITLPLPPGIGMPPTYLSPFESKPTRGFGGPGGHIAKVTTESPIINWVSFVDGNGNEMIIHGLDGYNVQSQLQGLAVDGNHRRYLFVASFGSVILSATWYRGDVSFAASLVILNNSTDIIPAPFDSHGQPADRVVISAPQVGSPGQPPAPNFYAFAYAARNGGNHELSSPIYATEVLP